MTIWVTFYSAIWQDNLIMFRRQDKYSFANPSIDGGQTVMDVYMHGIAPSWWCMRGCVGGGGRYISDTPDNREIFGKNIAKICKNIGQISVTHLTMGKSWQKYCTLVARLVSLGLVFILEVVWGLTGISSSLIHGTAASLSEERKHDLSPGHGHKCSIFDKKNI